MLDDQNVNPLLEALRHRHKLALRVFFLVILVLGAGAWLTRQYSASAVVALNPQAGSPGQPKSVVEVAWNALTDKQIAAIIQQFQLDTGLTYLLEQDHAFTYIRSNISLREDEPESSPSPEIVVSYTGQGRSTVVSVANALAQSLAQAKVTARQPSQTGSAATIAAALAESRSNLKLLSHGQNTENLQDDLQEHLKTDADLKAARRASMIKLAAIERERELATRAASKAHPQSRQIADQSGPQAVLRRQIKDAQASLDELRQRYTDQYPNVEDAREKLANLQAKLKSLPVPKPSQPPARIALTVDEMQMAREEAEIRASQRTLDQDISRNRNETEQLRKRISDTKTIAQNYVSELARYNALLEAQETEDASQNEADANLAPLFMVVKSATTVSALGIWVMPLFWFSSVLAGLLAGAFAALMAEQFAAPVDEGSPSRSLHLG